MNGKTSPVLAAKPCRRLNTKTSLKKREVTNTALVARPASPTELEDADAAGTDLIAKPVIANIAEVADDTALIAKPGVADVADNTALIAKPKIAGPTTPEIADLADVAFCSPVVPAAIWGWGKANVVH